MSTDRWTRFYKLTVASMKNRDFQLRIGLNVDPEFDANEERECTRGLYFCGPDQIIHWAEALCYDYVLDVEIPDDGTVFQYPTKSRADKLVLSNLRPIGDIYEQLFSTSPDKCRRFIVTYMVEYNRIESLKRIFASGDYSQYYADALAIAINRGNLDVVKYFYSVGVDCYGDAITPFSRKFPSDDGTGTFKMVKWLFNSAVERAVNYGHIEVIKYLYSIGAWDTIDMMGHAAIFGRIETLKYLYSIGVKCTTKAMDNAAKYGHLEALKYLHSIGAACTTDAMDSAAYGVARATRSMDIDASRGYIDVLQFLHSIGATYTARAMHSLTSDV